MVAACVADFRQCVVLGQISDRRSRLAGIVFGDERRRNIERTAFYAKALRLELLRQLAARQHFLVAQLRMLPDKAGDGFESFRIGIYRLKNRRFVHRSAPFFQHINILS
jgi:hypothetical protein